MAELGLLSPGSRVELIEGEVVDMAPMGPRHGGRISRLDRLFNRAVGDRAIVRVQVPLRLDNTSEPEPDLALVKPRDDFYEDSHPSAADTLLVIELCDTSLAYDLEIKLPLYAAHDVPEVWLLDLKGNELRVFHTPAASEYTHTSDHKPPGTISLTALPDISIDLNNLFRRKRGQTSAETPGSKEGE
jgi:Uma2 family endonuclease